MTRVILAVGVLSIRAVYADDLAGLMAEGRASIRRASHVEPAADGAGWTADLSPVGGPILGPFPLRAEALAAETAYLNQALEGADQWPL